MGAKVVLDLSGLGVSPTCGTSMAFKPTSEGMALDTSAQGGGQGCNGVATAVQQPSKTASAFWRGVALGTPTNNEYLFGVTFGDGNTTPFSSYVLVYQNDGTISGDTNVGGTTLHSVTAGTPANNVVVDVAVTVDMAVTGTIAVYLNGATITTDNTLGTTTIGYGTNAQLTIGGTSNAGQNACNARHLVGYTWNRALSSTEVQALHIDPYGLLAFPDDDLFAVATSIVSVASPYQPWYQLGPVLGQ
jgi:hypothetical protein